MKITQKKLQQIIKEETHNLLKEQNPEPAIERLKRKLGATEVRHGNDRVVGASVSANLKALSMSIADADTLGLKINWPGGADTPGKVIKAPTLGQQCAGGRPLMLYFFDNQGMLVGVALDPKSWREKGCS